MSASYRWTCMKIRGIFFPRSTNKLAGHAWEPTMCRNGIFYERTTLLSTVLPACICAPRRRFLRISARPFFDRTSQSYTFMVLDVSNVRTVSARGMPRIRWTKDNGTTRIRSVSMECRNSKCVEEPKSDMARRWRVDKANLQSSSIRNYCNVLTSK